MRRGLRTKCCAALILVLLTGCAGAGKTDGAQTDGAAADSAVWRDDLRPAPGAAKLGGPGTACDLPVSFDLPARWSAEPVAADDPVLLVAQGDFELRCEVDAKPAGHVGFLRVWVDDKAGTGAANGGDPAAALEAFLAAGRSPHADRQHRATTAGGLPGAEVTYIRDNPDAPGRERALAVVTAEGAVVLTLGGLDAGQHERMLPAYLLAKQSLAAEP